VVHNDHITIEIAAPDAELISTLEGRLFGARSHKNLYKKLKTILVKEGKWPAPQEHVVFAVCNGLQHAI
jgi:hypothetical protein